MEETAPRTGSDPGRDDWGATMHRTFRTLLLSLAGLLGSLLPTGCTSGQTGGQVSTPTDDAGGSACVEMESTILDENAISPLGFSAAGVLAYAEGAHSAEFAWGPEAHHADTLRVTPGEGLGAIEVTIERGDGTIRFIEQRLSSTEGNSGEGPAIGGEHCPSLLAIEVRVQVTTENGALDEVFDAELRSTAEDRAELHLPFTPEALQGSFAVEVMQANTEAKQFHISATLSPDAFSGAVVGILEVTQGETTAASRVTYGHWPATETSDLE